MHSDELYRCFDTPRKRCCRIPFFLYDPNCSASCAYYREVFEKFDTPPIRAELPKSCRLRPQWYWFTGLTPTTKSRSSHSQHYRRETTRHDLTRTENRSFPNSPQYPVKKTNCRSSVTRAAVTKGKPHQTSASGHLHGQLCDRCVNSLVFGSAGERLSLGRLSISRLPGCRQCEDWSSSSPTCGMHEPEN